MKEEKKDCEFLPVYENRVAVSASCECGVTFTPPKDVDSQSERYFFEQYKKHREARYGGPAS